VGGVGRVASRGGGYYLLGGAEAPGGPGGLGGMASILGNPLAKAALAGIAAMVVKRVMQGR
jgi:hypothetical protein